MRRIKAELYLAFVALLLTSGCIIECGIEDLKGNGNVAVEADTVHAGPGQLDLTAVTTVGFASASAAVHSIVIYHALTDGYGLNCGVD